MVRLSCVTVDGQKRVALPEARFDAGSRRCSRARAPGGRRSTLDTRLLPLPHGHQGPHSAPAMIQRAAVWPWSQGTGEVAEQARQSESDVAALVTTGMSSG